MLIWDWLGWLVEKVVRPRWVVHFDNAECQAADRGDLALCLFGFVCCVYYKWPDPMILFSRRYRVCRKREFGECMTSGKR